MARPESIAVAGYFATPPRLVPIIARLVAVAPKPVRAPNVYGSDHPTSFVDPCAGDGAAVIALAQAMAPSVERRFADACLYAIEMEATRAKSLEDNAHESIGYGTSHCVHSDAFQVSFAGPGASVLFLNPPYDTDRVYGRLEHRFLSRFTNALRSGGALLFLVPFYALKASADLLATEYDRVDCFRFPLPEWDSFRQVVLVARRGPKLMAPLASIRDRVLGWAEDAESIPVLTESPEALWTLGRDEEYTPLPEWTPRPVDAAALMAECVPWSFTDRSGQSQPIQGVLPIANGDLLARFYPTAMPPRPAHIAAGIAAGVFNGARVVPTDPKSKLPPLLVKGVFTKEYRTIDEKTNKDGETTGLIQIQQPKLVVTALDMDARKYYTLKSDAATSSATTVADMTTGDLLRHYSRSLLDTLLAHCPVQHDPTNPDHLLRLPLTIKGDFAALDNWDNEQTIPRELFHAQAHCVMGAVRLLGGLHVKPRARKGKAAIVLGEIGSGKSSVALATAHSINAKRLLIVCPPHLLQSWQDQAAAVTPWAPVSILSDVTDVERFAADKTDGLSIAVLSREAAKLGHAVEAVTKSCPKCGSALPKGDLAKRRSRCEATSFRPKNDAARWLAEYAVVVAPGFPDDSRVQTVIQSRFLRERLDGLEFVKPETIRSNPRVVDLAWRLASIAGSAAVDGHGEGLTGLYAVLDAIGDDKLTLAIARYLYIGSLPDTYHHGHGASLRTTAVKLLLLTAKSAVRRTLVAELREATLDAVSYGTSLWQDYDGSTDSDNASYNLQDRRDQGHRGVNGFVSAIGPIAQLAKWTQTPVCGEHLYQSVPEPRRTPLASYIAKRHPDLFDMLVLDEAHEFASENSAQSLAAHRLTALGIPTLLLTGSVMNGYAESLFANLWAISPAFRAEFQRDERSKFVDRYGYKKRLVEQRDKETGKPVEYGAMTDRVEEHGRDIGQAPGVLPLLILRHLLPISVTLHKADLALDLPKCTEIVERIAPSDAQLAGHIPMLQLLLKAIKRDRFEPELSGKLFGQLSEAPSQLDRATADVGNCDSGAFEVRYPESVGGELVARCEPLPESTILPKEEWMLARIESELAEGRNVMVFSWHVELLPRLARLIEARIGEKVVVLDSKVTTAKREAWINKEVVAKNRRVMLTNPVMVRTGLNPLVHFATEIFMENPACDPVTYRQAVGRVDRIGQKKETRILFPIYETETHVGMHGLLLTKVAVSMSTDGLDAEGALAAAGASEISHLAGISVGKHLYDLLSERADANPIRSVPVRKVAAKVRRAASLVAKAPAAAPVPASAPAPVVRVLPVPPPLPVEYELEPWEIALRNIRSAVDTYTREPWEIAVDAIRKATQ